MPINDLLDEDKCCRPWMETLHPDGLRCPEGHALPPGQAPHDRRRVTQGVGRGSFVETLRSEFHGLRSTVEGYAASATIAGGEDANACGLGLSEQAPWTLRLGVRTAAGVAVYLIDRWHEAGCDEDPGARRASAPTARQAQQLGRPPPVGEHRGGDQAARLRL
jgi:hypothetical protein